MHATTTMEQTIWRTGARWAVLLAGVIGTMAGAEKSPADKARMSTALMPGGGRITVEAEGVLPAVPLFFTAEADQAIRVGPTEVAGEIKLTLRVVQGRPEALTLGLTGDGEILSVTGAGLRDWSVRQGAGDTAGRRFLDLRPALVEGQDGPRVLELAVRTRQKDPTVPGRVALLLLAPGDAVGFDAHTRVEPDAAVDLRLTQATGVTALGDPRGPGGPLEFVAHGEGRIELALARRGAAPAEVDLTGVQLTGTANETGGSVDFRLRGQARVERAGARLRVLAGRAAPGDRAAGYGWHAELVAAGDESAYELVFERKGVIPVDFGFAAAIEEKGDWRRLDFRMPAGTVVPLTLSGLADGVEFDRTAPVVLVATAGAWQGFLPADGGAALAWKRTREKGEGTLFFTSSEQTDVRVGAGLLRQSSQIAFRILQGKLGGVRVRLDGPGEIVGVEGANVLGWKVLPGTADGTRMLEVRLSRPLESEGTLLVRSLSALGDFPVRAEPMRLTPEGGVRHSGFVRIANSGAVKLEVADSEGMMQLAPAQYPGAPAESGARQVFVYRFPSAEHAYRVLASRILPEVGVAEIATYTLGEIDRVIEADLELDVREAPLRDWSLSIPADYAVAAVQGAEVADYAVESAIENGYRTLKVLFGHPVEGRQLLRLRLEKNQAAGAGDWSLPPLKFPEAKSVRGTIGAAATPGYRLAAGSVRELAEVPLSYFPKQVTGLQQAFRLQEGDWSAALTVEALGQSVQADVFHLYSLKEGAVYASVLLNYFVVGAPANEWRIEVPAAAGNIEVSGQGVQRGWRREGNEVIVTLHQPVLGAATLLVTFEEPMSARGGVIAPGEVRPLGVQAERGYLEVVSPLQVKSEVRRAEGGLLKLEPLELPVEFRLLANAPALAVYQYTARPFAFALAVDWYQPGETAEQVVDFARLDSQISRDGQVVTEARFFVKTRGRKDLRLQLPEGVKLWEARVDGEAVHAGASGGLTLIPLPARLNPNEPVPVTLRLGQPAGPAAGRVSLTAPKLSAPLVMGEWTLRGDRERLLVPQGGTAELVRPNLTESGFEWISRRGRAAVAGLLLLLAVGGLLARVASRPWLPVGLMASLLALALAVDLALEAAGHRRVNTAQVNLAAMMVPADGVVSIELANVAPWRAMISWWGVAAAGAGVACLLRIARRGAAASGLLTAAGVMLLSLGLLAQRLGAVPFFLLIAVAAFLRLILPGIQRLRLAWRQRQAGSGPLTAPSSVVPLLMTAAIVGGLLGHAPAVRAENAAGSAPGWQAEARPVQAMVQRWEVRDGRIFAEVDLTVRGGPGDSFLLLRSPAVLTEFAGDGLRSGKVGNEKGADYYVMPEREGTLTARAKFELPVEDLSKGLPLLTGPAAMQRVTIQLDQGGWEFASPRAVQVQPTAGLGEGKSGATLILGPDGAPVINLVPQRRDLAAEATQFYVETASLYVPGPGVVSGSARITVRPVQGRVSALDLEVPADFTVGDVARGPVGAWRFDPEKRRLHVAVEPAQAQVFSFVIETQRGAAALPFDLSLQSLHVTGAAGEVGVLALAFGADAQPEGIRPAGLSPVSLADFDPALLPRGRDGQPLAALQSAYRYSQNTGTVTLRVAPVAPEVRVTSRQVLSLGDDRLVLAADLDVTIARVGLFQLSFALPEGLEVEALSGPALSHWTEAAEGGRKIVTLHLNGRTLGEQSLALTLVGPAPAAQAAWRVPQVALREAARQTGELQLVPEKSLRLRTIDRSGVSELDPRTLGDARPGALAFRLLQSDWALTMGIEALEPWVTVQSLQEVTIREGQTLTRLGLRYRVESAAVKQLRVQLPGLSDDEVKTVRATGPAVSDFVPVPGVAGGWEIRFQHGIVGETAVQIEFQGPAGRETGRERVATPVFEGVRQIAQFVAVRSGGRLELEAADLPRGWQRVDWGSVPVVLQDRSVPALAFRVAEPEQALAVTVRRHEVADALKLRATEGTLTTVFSPEGSSLTAVELQMDVAEKSTLRVRLPEGARLFNTLVNRESVPVVREGEAYLFHVSANTAAERLARVRLVYSTAPARDGRIALVAPGLNVPLENVSWQVMVPPGYRLAGYRGGLQLREDRAAGSFGLDDYQALVVAKRAAEAKQATDFLQQANALLLKGDQQRAGEVLSRVSNAKSLDEATNEDARVQLRALRTQQAVIGLNTRRQRIYLDSGADAVRNEQLEQAASANPFMRGKLNFDPQQVDQMLMGNSVEDNAALSGIAARIVDQQLAAEPAPGAIDVTLPRSGEILTFSRSLQVDGALPLELRLDLVRDRGARGGFELGLLGALGIVGLLVLRRRPVI